MRLAPPLFCGLLSLVSGCHEPDRWQSLAAETGRVLDIWTDESTVYWLAGDDVYHGRVMALSRTQGVTTTLATGQTNPGALVGDGQALYWWNYGDIVSLGSLLRLPLGGGEPSVIAEPSAIAASLGYPCYVVGRSLVVRDGSAYLLCEEESTHNGVLLQIPCEGGDARAIREDLPVGSWGLAFDGSRFFVVSPEARQVVALSVATGEVTVLENDADVSWSIAVTADAVFWTRSSGAVVRHDKATQATEELTERGTGSVSLDADDAHAWWLMTTDDIGFSVHHAGATGAATLDGNVQCATALHADGAAFIGSSPCSARDSGEIGEISLDR